MTTRLPGIVTLAVTLALGLSPMACDDDGPSQSGAGGTAGVVIGGRGGTGGRGGAGGSGTGGAVNRGGAGGGTGGVAAGGAVGDAGGDMTAVGGAPGAGGADAPAAVDVASDIAVVVDMQPDLPAPPPDTAPTTVMVSACSQFNCPALTNVASACVAHLDEVDCTYETTMQNPKHTNYCHTNGVKKLARTVYSGNSYTTTMDVRKPDNSACYTVVIAGSGSGTSDVQNWTYRSPSGQQLATAVWRASDEVLTISCNNVNYVIGDVGCPGTDGQPDDADAAQCTAGNCDD